MIKDRISRLQEQIAQVCRKSGRNPADITLVAVTKFATLEQMREAVGCGLTHFGENKVQEAQKKFSALDASVTKHMIGHLQTNKVKAALEIFDMIQSVDSLKLANALQTQAVNRNHPVDILLQVNTAGEEQKYGFSKSDCLAAMKELAGLSHLRMKGLMTIAPLVEEEDTIRTCFCDLRHLYEQIGAEYKGHERVNMQYLSMGMTHDYNIAIEEGANMVRIGRAIFQQ